MLIKFAEKDTTGPSISDQEGKAGDVFIGWALGSSKQQRTLAGKSSIHIPDRFMISFTFSLFCSVYPD